MKRALGPIFASWSERPSRTRGHAERPVGGGGRRARRRRAPRAHRRAGGVPRRPSRPGPGHELRRGDHPHAQAQGRAPRDGGHRALPQARDQRRGGDDRDVPRRGLDQEDRGRLRDPPGARHLDGDRSRPQREGVRLGRGVAEPPARLGPPLRLRRRHIPEAQPGEARTRTSPS